MKDGYVLRLTDANYTKWACEWRPSWKTEPDWASTGSIGEAEVFPTVEAAKAFATKYNLHAEVYRFVLEPVEG